jgi:hypothetical protein
LRAVDERENAALTRLRADCRDRKEIADRVRHVRDRDEPRAWRRRLEEGVDVRRRTWMWRDDRDLDDAEAEPL